MDTVTDLSRRAFLLTALTLPRRDVLLAQEPKIPARPGPDMEKPRQLLEEYSQQKKLIHFGQDMPTPDMMVKDQAAFEKTPFQGCVFRFLIPKSFAQGTSVEGKDPHFHRLVWQDRPIPWEQIVPTAKKMQEFKSDQFTSNFVRVNIEPGTVDCFDDKGFKSVLHNIRMAARLARLSPGCAGICFDTEPYNVKDGLILTYRTRPNTTDPKAPGYRSFEAYSAQTKLRGEQIIKVMQEEFPGLHVLISHGWEKVSINEGPTTKVGRLLPPLLDGMLKGASGATLIIDGYEKSYGYKRPEDFAAGRKEMLQTNLSRTSEPELYKLRARPAFGLAVDWPHKPGTFSAADTKGNHFQPAEFQTAVEHGMRNGEYVWLYGYSATGAWFAVDKNKPATIPDAYRDAVIAGNKAFRDESEKRAKGKK